MRARVLLPLPFLSCALLYGQSQYALITASNIADTAGNRLASGTITFTPVLTPGSTLPASPHLVDGGRGLATPVTFNVIAGELSPIYGTAQLVDVTQANPANFCYADSIHDNNSGETWTPDACVQPAYNASWCSVTSGQTTCDFDNYVPTGTPGALQTAGPIGPTGPAGTLNPRGNWAASTAYAKNDVFVESGTGYLVVTAYTSGSAFGSTDTTNSVQIATGCSGTPCAPSLLTVGTSVYPTGQGVWHRYGPVIMADPTFGNPWQSGEVTIFPPGSTTTNCLVFPAALYTNQCWKAIVDTGTYVMYAESLDGAHDWQFGSGNGATCGADGICSIIDSHSRERAFFNPNDDKYYLYAANVANTQLDLYVSTDGLHYPTSPSYAAVVTPSVCATQGWATSCGAVDNSTGMFVGSTFYMLLDFGSGSGLFSAPITAMQTLTPIGSSFALPQGSVRSPIYTVSGQPGPCGNGSVYWTWIHEIGDNQIHRMCATALGGPWTDALGGNPDFGIVSEEEGAGLLASAANAQAVDPFVVQWQAKTYLFDSTAQQALSGSPPAVPYYSQAELSIADMPVSSLVQTFGGTDAGPEPNQLGGMLSVDYFTDGVNFHNHPITNVGLAVINGILEPKEGIDCQEDCQLISASGQPLILGANGVEKLRFNVANVFYPHDDNVVSLGAVGNAWALVATNEVVSDSGAPLVLKSNGGAEAITFGSTGQFYPDVDNTVNLGAVGNGWAEVVSHAYFAGSTAGVSSTTCTQWTDGLCTHN